MLGVVMAICFCLLLCFVLMAFAFFVPFVPKAFRVLLDAHALVRLTLRAIPFVISLTSYSLVCSSSLFMVELLCSFLTFVSSLFGSASPLLGIAFGSYPAFLSASLLLLA